MNTSVKPTYDIRAVLAKVTLSDLYEMVRDCVGMFGQNEAIDLLIEFEYIDNVADFVKDVAADHPEIAAMQDAVTPNYDLSVILTKIKYCDLAEMVRDCVGMFGRKEAIDLLIDNHYIGNVADFIEESAQDNPALRAMLPKDRQPREQYNADGTCAHADVTLLERCRLCNACVAVTININNNEHCNQSPLIE